MSGAPLWAQGRIIGVIVRHEDDAPNVLTAARFDGFLPRDPADLQRVGALLELQPGPLRVLPPKPQGRLRNWSIVLAVGPCVLSVAAAAFVAVSGVPEGLPGAPPRVAAYSPCGTGSVSPGTWSSPGELHGSDAANEVYLKVRMSSNGTFQGSYKHYSLAGYTAIQIPHYDMMGNVSYTTMSVPNYRPDGEAKDVAGCLDVVNNQGNLTMKSLSRTSFRLSTTNDNGYRLDFPDKYRFSLGYLYH
jgi:hypothetical protein